jgi:large conductance mechanosensitive channel
LSGFRKFLLQGNLIALATAVVIGGAFSAVVTALVKVIMDLIGKLGGTPNYSDYAPGGVHVGAFLTALISFIVVAAVVYFFIVMPYTKAKERFFPDPEPGETAEDLLTEIRDILKGQATQTLPSDPKE